MTYLEHVIYSIEKGTHERRTQQHEKEVKAPYTRECELPLKCLMSKDMAVE